MKFGHYLESATVPEWAPKYVDYHSGKKVIKAEVKRIELDFKIEDHATAVRQESAGAISLRSRRRGPSGTSTEMSNEFSAFVEQEIAKVNSFYALKLDKARRRQVELEAQMEAVESQQQQQHDRVSSAVDLDKHKNGLGLGPVYTITELVPRELQGVQARQQLHKLGTAIGEYYHLLTMLQNYKILNQTALTKLVKKYDKKTHHVTLDALKTRLQGEPFVADTTVAALIHDAEKMYGSIHKDPKLAIQRLRTPKSKTSKGTLIRLGFFSGLAVCPALLLVWFAVGMRETIQYSKVESMARMFRGILLPVFLLFLFGLDVRVWKRLRVNYVFIFEKNPKTTKSWAEVLEVAAMLGALWAAFVVFYTLAAYYDQPTLAEYTPLMLAACVVAFLFNPCPVLAYPSRMWLVRFMSRVVRAPFLAVTFPDFWLADQLMSLEIAFLDWTYLVCFYATARDVEQSTVCIDPRYGFKPLVVSLPPWFRVAQCMRRYRDTREAFPHLANALKYSLSFLVIIFSTLDPGGAWNPMRTCWALACVVNATYSAVWDLKMDWGLLERRAPYPLLKRTLLMPAWRYYVAAAVDVVLRFTWTLSISPGILTFVWHTEGLRTILALLSVARRGLWNVFRLENEHLANCGKFRAVREIPLPFPVPELSPNLADENV